MNVLLH
jgi:hypothetical protein